MFTGKLWTQTDPIRYPLSARIQYSIWDKMGPKLRSHRCDTKSPYVVKRLYISTGTVHAIICQKLQSLVSQDALCWQPCQPLADPRYPAIWESKNLWYPGGACYMHTLTITMLNWYYWFTCRCFKIVMFHGKLFLWMLHYPFFLQHCVSRQGSVSLTWELLTSSHLQAFVNYH